MIAQRDITFDNGVDWPAGTLYSPEADRPRPCVLIVHGSGPCGRTGADASLLPVIAHLTGSGHAVLSYNKPGVGGSGGNWTTQTFEDRAGETLAALHFLTAQPEVREDAAGLRARP